MDFFLLFYTRRECRLEPIVEEEGEGRGARGPGGGGSLWRSAVFVATNPNGHPVYRHNMTSSLALCTGRVFCFGEYASKIRDGQV